MDVEHTKIRFAKEEMGLYDSDTGDSVKAVHMVDLTSCCSKAKRCVIKYGIVQRGLIAQVCNWYKWNRDLGSTVHYFLDETTQRELSSDSVFERTAVGMGANPDMLATAIYANKPDVW